MAGILRTAWRKLFGPTEAERQQLEHSRQVRALALRQFEAAVTNRLNRYRFANADAAGENLNLDLHADLARMRKRCSHEARNNSYVRAFCNTLATHTVGGGHPTLHLTSEKSPAFATWARTAFATWAEHAMADGRSLGRGLRDAVRRLPQTGEIVMQMVSDRSASGVQLRLKRINPAQLSTPWGKADGGRLWMGVERNDLGRPVAYWFDQNTDPMNAQPDYQRVPAENVLHFFRQDDEGAVRGYPWLAPVIEVVRKLRDYDDAVLEAAEAAALLSVILFNPNAGENPIDLNGGSIELEKKTIMAAPPGWEPKQINPAQPGNMYETFKRGKVAEGGLALGMPLIIAALDSQNTSYSGGRIDVQEFGGQVACLQHELEEDLCDRVLLAWLAEAARMRGEAIPADLNWQWGWSRVPHVDPEKEANANRMRIQDGTLTVDMAVAADGKDPEEVERKRAEEKKRADKRFIERIDAALEEIESRPRVAKAGVDHAMVLAQSGAETAPAAFLQAAASAQAINAQAGGDASGSADKSKAKDASDAG